MSECSRIWSLVNQFSFIIRTQYWFMLCIDILGRRRQIDEILSAVNSSLRRSVWSSVSQ